MDKGLHQSMVYETEYEQGLFLIGHLDLRPSSIVLFLLDV
jgi:hypothetical protein